MIDTVPPRGHIAHSTVELLADGSYTVKTGTAEFGNGTTTVHVQLAASALGCDAGQVAIRHSDTDLVEHDTGAYGSSGTVVAGKATYAAALGLADRLRDLGAEVAGVPAAECVLGPEGLDCAGTLLDLPRLHAEAQLRGLGLVHTGQWGGSPRSVAFNVQGFRVAMNPATGELRILQSVQAVDAGTVINPMQCRGQVEGAVAQAVGWALYERMVFDEQGRVVNPTLRNYRIPAFADAPRIEVFFADTRDALGPLGAKGMGECPVNPVAPALANALADATGVRFRDLPFTPDRIYRRIFERHVV
jgi:CO/xanthine dehydrogenase Mo-binding subunit